MKSGNRLRDLSCVLQHSRFRLLLLNGFRSVKNNHIADPRDQVTPAPLGQLWGQFLLLLFELVELHFDHSQHPELPEAK